MNVQVATKGSLLRGLRYRLLSAGLAIVLLLDGVYSYGQDGNPWRILSMLGWAIFGASGFMRPAVFAEDLRMDKPRTEELAFITPRQSKIGKFVGLGIVVVAVIAKYARAA